jgi:hypothetical protein
VTKAARIAEIEAEVGVLLLQIMSLYAQWEQLGGEAGNSTQAQINLGRAIRDVTAEVSAAKSN